MVKHKGGSLMKMFSEKFHNPQLIYRVYANFEVQSTRQYSLNFG